MKNIRYCCQELMTGVLSKTSNLKLTIREEKYLTYVDLELDGIQIEYCPFCGQKIQYSFLNFDDEIIIGNRRKKKRAA